MRKSIQYFMFVFSLAVIAWCFLSHFNVDWWLPSVSVVIDHYPNITVLIIYGLGYLASSLLQPPQQTVAASSAPAKVFPNPSLRKVAPRLSAAQKRRILQIYRRIEDPSEIISVLRLENPQNLDVSLSQVEDVIKLQEKD